MATHVTPLPPSLPSFSHPRHVLGEVTRLTGCSDKNFLNAILFEIVDSNDQPYIQFIVVYARTIVFIAISISITGKNAENWNIYGHHKHNQPSCSLHKYYHN